MSGRARTRAAMAVSAALLAGLGAGCASATAAPLGQAPQAPQQGGAQHGPTVGTLPGTRTGVGQAVMMRPGSTCPSTSTDPAIRKLRAGVSQVALPPDFQPVAAVRCDSATRLVPGDGEWDFSDAQRADSGVAALLAALRLPSQTAAPGANFACPAMAMALPPFALVDAKGDILSPLLPHEACGFPLKQATDAINALPWRTETDQRLSQTQTQAEIDTGCTPQFKYVFELSGYGTPKPWNQTDGSAIPRPTSECIYAVGPKAPDDYVSPGSFTQGAKLTSAQQSALTNALGHANETPAPACNTKATRFVVFDGPGTGMVIELDGCKRIRWPNDFMSTAPADLLNLITSAVSH